MKRLTEKDWKDKCEGYPWNVHPVKDIDDLPYYKKLAAYEDAEEQGLLLWLPCKVGDAVYVIVGKNISEQRVQRATIDSEGKIEFCTRKRGFALFDFGKTVFLTRAEAEAKLKSDLN